MVSIVQAEGIGAGGAIDNLLGTPLQEARQELISAFKNPEELRQHQAEALQLPKVAEFRGELERYIERAQLIAEMLANESGPVINAFNHTNTELRHAWQVQAVCYDHAVPNIVARISIPVEEADKHDGLQNALTGRRFTPKDFTYSYHTERIDDNGNILCNKCQLPTTLEAGAKVHRLVPRPKASHKAVEEGIIANIARRFYNGYDANGKGESVRREVRQNLEVLMRVGEGGIYSSLYEALEQIRHRLVTAAHVAKNADLNRLSLKFRELVGYSHRITQSKEQLAHLKGRELFKALEDIAAEHIPSPVVVTQIRTKGQTFVDKATIREYHGMLLEAYKSGMLQKYLASLGITMEKPLKETPPNLDDLVGAQALTHDNKETYDFTELHADPHALVRDLNDSISSAHYLLRTVAEIPQQLCGYEREETPATRDGRKPKVRMPPAKNGHKFGTLGLHKTSTGFVFDFRSGPEANRFDDYITFAKESGYMAIHVPVSSRDEWLEGATIEFKIKPNAVENAEVWLGRIGHEQHKLEQAGMIAFLMHEGFLSRVEWEANKLLLTPPGRAYIEPKLITASAVPNGNGKSAAYIRKMVERDRQL
ncbi:hypothetical protein HYU40_02920 [Candidatus Woesearchaeota archaeon]|nr:hypothetical protein [Candidatus Woesearchaeota archaeon]